MGSIRPASLAPLVAGGGGLISSGIAPSSINPFPSGGGGLDPLLDPNNSNLLAYLDPNDRSGTTAIDQSPQGNDFTTSGVTVESGVGGDVFNLGSGSNYIRIPAAVTSTEFTAVGWWKPQTTSVGNQQIVFSNYGFSANKRSFEILEYPSPAEARAQVSDDGGAATVASYAGLDPAVGTWYWVMVSVTLTDIRIWLKADGQADAGSPATYPAAGGVYNSLVDSFFGARDTNADGTPDANYANISIGRWRFFDYAITDNADADKLYLELASS